MNTEIQSEFLKLQGNPKNLESIINVDLYKCNNIERYYELFKDLVNCKSLIISCTIIDSPPPFEHLKSLEELYLRKCEINIEDFKLIISSISKLKNFRHINFQSLKTNGKIKESALIEKLPNLEFINFKKINRISDATPQIISLDEKQIIKEVKFNNNQPEIVISFPISENVESKIQQAVKNTKSILKKSVAVSASHSRNPTPTKSVQSPNRKIMANTPEIPKIASPSQITTSSRMSPSNPSRVISPNSAKPSPLTAAQVKPAPAKPAPSQAKPAKAKPAPAQVKPAQAKPVTAQAKPAQAKPAPAKHAHAQVKPAPRLQRETRNDMKKIEECISKMDKNDLEKIEKLINSRKSLLLEQSN